MIFGELLSKPLSVKDADSRFGLRAAAQKEEDEKNWNGHAEKPQENPAKLAGLVITGI